MISYTPALRQDLPLLFQLNRQLIDTYEDVSAIDYEKVLLWVEGNLERNLPNFRRILLSGETVGFFCLESGEIDSLFVFPEHQGKGIGTEVIRHCQSQSPALMLYVFRKNLRALALYRRLGFEITKEVGTTRYIMEWKNQNP